MKQLIKWKKGKKFLFAPEVEVVAQPIINKYHKHIKRAKIAYIFRRAIKGVGDRHVELGRMSRMTDKFKLFADYDFVMEISWKHWKSMKDKTRQALVDHELCHCGSKVDLKTGKETFHIIHHDLEEFKCIVERYGFWSNNLKSFAEAVKRVKY